MGDQIPLDSYAGEQLVDIPRLTSMIGNDEMHRLERQRRAWQKDDVERSLGRFGGTAIEAAKDPHSSGKSKIAGVKRLVRQGVPPDLRPRVWTASLNVGAMEHYAYDFETAKRRTFGSTPHDPAKTPLFGGRMPTSLPLTEAGYRVAEQILAIVAFTFAKLEYAPSIPPLTCLLLLQASPTQTLGVLVSILRHGSTERLSGYFSLSQKDAHLLAFVFTDLVHEKLSKLAAHVRALPNSEASWPALWFDLFASLFTDVLPLPSLLRVVDVFLFEGFKALYRVGLGALKRMEKAAAAAGSVEALAEVVTTEFASARGPRFEELLAHGFDVSLSRAHLDTLKFRNLSRVSRHLAELEQQAPHDMPELSKPSEIVTVQGLQMLWHYVPQRHRICNLEQVFSSRANGHSLGRLFEHCGTAGPLLLLVKTVKAECFGAFLSHPWSERKPRASFGSGECLLFRLSQPPQVFPWVKLRDREAQDAEFFMMGDAGQALIVGGGGGHFGLWIDTDLRYGKSESCSTFANEPLCEGDRFEILCVEVYSFV